MTVNSLQSLLNSRQIVGGGELDCRTQLSEMDIAIVDSVFEKLKILFPVGAPKRDVEGGHKAEWLKTLSAQGIRSAEQVQFGLNRARREQGDRLFWPTPRQFCAWCLPCANDVGLPDSGEAFREALKHYKNAARHTWSHELVWLAVHETGNWLFSRGSKKEVLEVFTCNYEVLIRRYIAGEVFDVELPKLLPPKVNIPTKPDDAKKNIDVLRRNFGLKVRNKFGE